MIRLWLAAALLWAAEPRWYAPPVLSAGTVNEVYGWDEGPVAPFTVEVVRPGEKTIVTAQSFVVDHPLPGVTGGPAGFHWSAALVCPDALDAPGPVTVRFLGTDGGVLASVKVGDVVAAGDRIALSGATGLVTGPHPPLGDPS